LDCQSQIAIAGAVGVDQKTISNWIQKIRECADFVEPPSSRQHFDIWQFQIAESVGITKQAVALILPDLARLPISANPTPQPPITVWSERPTQRHHRAGHLTT
jgi:DNA-binding XRE family transcriptional regulator